jgi:hypothetical protein
MRLNGKIIVPCFKIMLESKQGKCSQTKPNQTNALTFVLIPAVKRETWV